jgi:Lipid A 3-O-deacylase (PagL)
MRTTLTGKRCFRLPFFSLMDLIQQLLFCCLVATAGPLAACGQTARSGEASATTAQSASAKSEEGIQKGWNELAVWGGISFQSPTLIGKTPHARLANIALRYGRVLTASKTVAFELTIDAIPLAILSIERFNLIPTAPGSFVVKRTRENVYGGGLSPIGLKFNFRPRHRVQPFANTTGGFLYFREDVPVPGAARFNFTFDFSGGIQLINSSRRAFTIGYKYQHISNGERSSINPGVDVQVIYAGFSIFR